MAERGILIHYCLRDTLVEIEHLVHGLAVDAETAREGLLFGERDAADGVLRRIEEGGPQLAALRDRLRAAQSNGEGRAGCHGDGPAA